MARKSKGKAKKGTTKKDFEMIVERLVVESEEIVKGTILSMGSKIIQRSPVGNYRLWKSFQKTGKPPKNYVGGRFRMNWVSSINTLDASRQTGTDPSGMEAMTRLKMKVDDLEAGNVFFMANSLPYAMELEFGHSTQAPNGIVRTVLQEYAQAITEAKAKRP
jgi:hypothetical protein